MEPEVLKFITYMNDNISERPQCLMFAMLLKLKFSSAVILHGAPGHCIAFIDGKYYDWDGEAERTLGFAEFPEKYGDHHIVDHYYAIKDKFNQEEMTI